MPFKREVIIEEGIGEDNVIIRTFPPFRMETREQLFDEMCYLAGLMADNPDVVVSVTIKIEKDD